MSKQAVLLLAHGTPERVDQIPAYLSNVVSGRPLPPHVVEEIQHRYTQIGHSPLNELTMEQARLVAAELNTAGETAPVYVAMRNWHPYIADVMQQMRADGVQEVAVICLAPQNSRTSVGLYRRVVEEHRNGLRVDFTEGWAQHSLLIAAFAERLREAQAKFPAPVPVLFTAHSVPVRTLQASANAPADPYAEEARHTAEFVAAALPQIPCWWFAFQSQGASGGEWIGPTVEETIDTIATEGVKALLLQPIGFLCDHIEILYDIDIHFRKYAADRSIQLQRPESLNTSPLLAKAVTDLARQGLKRLQSSSL